MTFVAAIHQKRTSPFPSTNPLHMLMKPAPSSGPRPGVPTRADIWGFLAAAGFKVLPGVRLVDSPRGCLALQSHRLQPQSGCLVLTVTDAGCGSKLRLSTGFFFHTIF